MSSLRRGGGGTVTRELTAYATGTRSSATNEATATGDASRAEGGAVATATRAHAEGSSTASGHTSHAEGSSCQASGTNSHAEGASSTASGHTSHAEGTSCTASGINSHAQGRGAAASRYGQHAQASGQFTAVGDAQTNVLLARRQTTDATPTVLTFDDGAVNLTAGSGNGINVLTIPAGRAHVLRISVVARTAADSAGWTFETMVARGNSGSATFKGNQSPVNQWPDSGAAWAVALAINTSDATNNYLTITATGQAGVTIRWVARIETVEVGG